MNITTIRETAKFAVGRTGLILQKYSPEILLGVGIVGSIGTTILACRATKKVDFIVDTFKDEMDYIQEAEETETQPENANYKKDRVRLYIQTGVEFGKLYGPTIALGLASYSCIIGGHKIMSKRNVALVGAYKVLEKGFGEYRKRLIEEYGEDVDFQFKNGIRNESVSVVEEDKDGKKKKVKKTIQVVDPNGYSVYSRFFDESCRNWCKTPEFNLVFLQAQQNYANNRLQARGHLFLNEVYDMLGLPHSQAGAIVGWVRDKESDNFVDFGIYDFEDTKARDFVNGYEPTILLDFNVDGVIWDKI